MAEIIVCIGLAMELIAYSITGEPEHTYYLISRGSIVVTIGLWWGLQKLAMARKKEQLANDQ